MDETYEAVMPVRHDVAFNEWTRRTKLPCRYAMMRP